jgi:hypothetical protein
VADGTVFVDREMPLVQGLGVKVLRIEFPWFLVEPGRDQYVWTRADYIVRSASTHHVELQPVIVYSPPWAAPQPSNPPDAAAFGAFAAAAARRYAGTIRYWEIWNEPNLGKYWTGGAQSYVSKLLAPAYQAIHGASADAEVMLGGPAGADMNWLNAVHAAGGAFDILAFHDYGSAASIKSNAVSLHTWLEGIGQAGTPIWLGEFGVQQSEVHDTSQQGLITAVLKGNAPLAVAEWYNLRDDFSMTCCPPQVAVTGYWGLVKHDGQTLKDGYQTMQRLAPPG